MLEVKGIKAKIQEKIVLKGVDLSLEKGEILALMGPNGSGKTSLAYVLMGHPKYEVIDGKILLDGEDITDEETHVRSIKGLFLAFQTPPEIPGVKLSNLLLAAYNKRKGVEGDLLKLVDTRFVSQTQKLVQMVGLPRDMLYREVNIGFSGGEKKRSEFLQAQVLDPNYIILDEPDSGLDADGLKMVGDMIAEMREKGKGVLLITHYTRIFKHVKPDKVMIMVNGKIVAKDGLELAEKIDSIGYRGLLKELGEENNE